MSNPNQLRYILLKGRVSAEAIGMKWGEGMQAQGMPLEDHVVKLLVQQFETNGRAPPGYKTYDYYDKAKNLAISIKIMDTQTPARLKKPK